MRDLGSFVARSGCSLAAMAVSLVVTAPASAQTAAPAPAPAASEASDQDAAGNDEIIVTGSRVDRLGFDAPTPTTVLGASDIQRSGRPSLALAIDDLPSVRATNTPQNTAANTNAGTSTVDLRGLGDNRTLTLLNGRRFSGSADLNTVPMNLVKRVDIVTGGASAAWGSGAVAGVVNIELDDSIDGLALSGSAGVSARGDGGRYNADIRYGTSFAGGAGHIMVSAAYQSDTGIIDRNSRFGLSAGLLPNPAYTPTNGQAALVLYPDVNYAAASPSGLITNGVLAGQTFRTDGSLRPFVYGSPRTSTLMVGGEGENSSDQYPLFPPSNRLNLYGRVTHELGGATFWADASYTHVTGDILTRSEYNLGNLTISADNVFLRPEIRQQLVNAGQPSFLMGRIFDDYGRWVFDINRSNTEGAVGVDGTIGGGMWRYSAYYGHGRYTDDFHFNNLLITQNFLNAVDAVAGPGGAPVCRIALTNPTTDCRPLNIFGSGNADPAAISYAFATASSHSRTTLDTYGASLRGEPFRLFDRPVSVAVGVEGRREGVDITVDPRSQAQQFRTINIGTLNGSFNVKEAFGEVVVPVLNFADTAVVDFNGAARYSDYSTSGGIWSWKLGLSGKLFDTLRVRAVQSRDIRSPSLTELFSQRKTNTATIVDPVTNRPVPVTRLLGGNPSLLPEIGNTTTLGISLEPKFVPGFNFSVDFYRIKISDAVTALSPQDIVNGCAAGSAALCALFTRDSAGQIGTITASYVNLAKYETKGLDFELAYTTPLSALIDGAAGRLRFRTLATRAIRTIVDTGVQQLSRVGVVGDTATFNTPKWQGSATLVYERKEGSADIRLRYVGGGVFDKTLSIQNNQISARTYTDLGLSANIEKFAMSFRVNNLFDVKPPLITYRSPFYDTIGRYFTVSVSAGF